MIAKTASPTTVRCPACGHPLDPPDAARCPLCQQSLATEDSRSTGVDITPYAKAFEEGRGAWVSMCKWVCLAGSQRLKHLAMIRASDASRRFALISCLWFSLGLAVFQGARSGWHQVLVAADSTVVIKPAGQGWTKVVPARSGGGAELWWNPGQAMVSAAAGGLLGLVILSILRGLATWGVRRAHHIAFRDEQRMTAALHYSLAWGGPAALGAMLCVLRIPAILGAAARWSLVPPDMAVLMVGGVLAAISMTGLWIWLVRLADSAPQSSRGRVMAFFVVGAPLMVAGGAAAWWYGWEQGGPRLFAALNMRF